jgi:cytochrome c oxidase subunit 4
MLRAHSLSPLGYAAICLVLVLLTILTVSVSFIDVPGIWHIVIGLTIGVTKASLVVLFFMHALYSPRLIWIVIATAGFWLGILLVLTYTDYFTRGLLPGVPGH